jgi:hypothetical protein
VQKGDVRITRLLGALFVDASPVINEIGLGALRQAQVFVGFLLDLGKLGTQGLEIISRRGGTGAVGLAASIGHHGLI